MAIIDNEILDKMNYFTTGDAATFFGEANVNVYLDRYTKGWSIIRIKRWLYVTQRRVDYIKKLNKRTSYLQYLATNVLLTPSYLSTVYVLFLNNILTENVYTMTLVTSKKTTTLSNSFQRCVYQNIHDDLFWWYEIKKNGDFVYFQAYPEKALLDWLWLKKDLVLSLDYFKELRIRIELINFTRLKQFVKKYNKRKIDTAFILLQQLRWL